MSSAAAAGGVTIAVDVTESGSYILSPAPETVVIAAGTTTVTLAVSTDDDDVGERSGSITVRITTAAGYTVAPPPDHQAAVTVLDNETPAASIAADSLTITEGAAATFRVTLGSAAPAGGLTISVDVTESGSYIAGSAPETVVIAAGETTGTLAVSTDDDETGERSGSITAELDAGAGYTVGTPNIALVTVSDDDLPVVDEDGDGLIEIHNLTQLNNIRYNLAGTGVVSMLLPDAPGNTTGCPTLDTPIWVHNTTGEVLTSSPSAQDTVSYTRRDTCYGYELVRSLDFNDANNDGNHADAYDTDLDTANGNWTPIGDLDFDDFDDFGDPFTGTFAGNGNTISNMSVAITRTNARLGLFGVGLFGLIDAGAVIRDVGLVGVSVRDTRANSDAGGLVGDNFGTISGSYVIGSVSNGGYRAGGLVGFNRSAGTIRDSYATGSVTGGGDIGGLVGDNAGAIRNSYATGSVTGGGENEFASIGGLVGENDGTIRDSYATGSVTGGGENEFASIGGLVGNNRRTIRDSYATGSVTGGGENEFASIGGLVGENDGTIRDSYATGSVTGGGENEFASIGGLVGNNRRTIRDSYWNTETSGQLASAGGIGQNTLQLVTQTATTGSIYESWTARSTVSPGESLWDFGDNRQYPGLRLPLSTADCTVGAGTPLCTHRPADPDTVASISANPLPIIEGVPATFRVTLSSTGLVDRVTVSVRVTESGSYISGSAPETVVIAAGVTTVTLAVSTEDDELGERSGSITVRITTGVGYTAAAAPDHQAAVTVLDNETPAASISAGPSPIFEDVPATFRVTLGSAAPAGGLTISVRVTESGSYISGSAPETVVIASGATTVTLAVSTDDDEMIEGTGIITATINGGTGYTVGTQSMARVTVLDNDDPVDEDGDGLIEIRTLAELNNIRYNLAGTSAENRLVPADPGNTTGCPTLASPIWVHNTAGDVLTSAPSAQDTASYTRRDTCYGYELVRSLDFNDANNDGNHDDAYDTDLDTTNGNWTPIGDFDNQFIGTFDGNDNTISNMSVAMTGPPAGLFGSTSVGAVIRYVGLVGVSVRSGSNAGGLVGYNAGGTIRGSYVTGSVTGSGDIGGLVGRNRNGGTISDSYATGSVSGRFAGGLVGSNNRGDIENSYATGSVSGSTPGGLVGSNYGTINASYAVSGRTAGGLVGENFGTIRDSYWNTETSGQLASAGGVGQTTLQLVTQTAATGSIYESWTARSTVLPGEPLWDFGDNRQYPGLRLPLSTADCTVSADTPLCTHRPADPDPTARISAGPSPITEGADATFTVTLSSAAPAGGVTVRVGVTQNGNYIDGAAPETVDVDIAEGATTGTLRVTTTDDTTDEPNGSITAELTTGTGYRVGTENTASVTVNDNDPVASITADPTPITEGAVATFTVTLSSAAPAGGVTVRVGVTENGSYIVGSAPTTVFIAVGATTGMLMVTTTDDTTDEPAGSITAELNAGADYTVGILSTAMVTVLDNDDPVANISAGPSPITEGTAAIFRVTLSSAAPAGGLTIAVLTRTQTIGNEGLPILDVALETVFIASGATTGTLAVSTDDLDELGGIIFALISSGTGYTVGTPNNSATVTVYADGTVVSISAGPSPITEGAAATFTVTLSSAAPAGGLTISVGVTERESYIDGLAPETVFIAAGARTVTLTVETDDDNLDESSGIIIAEINMGTGYTPAPGNLAAGVTVLDNDDPAPVASITAPAPTTITAGTDATFRVTLDRAAPAGGLTISVRVTERESYIADPAPETVFIVAGATTVTLTVLTEDDSIDEPDGSITVTINIGTRYTVGTPNRAMVTVTDDDVLLASITAADPTTITEGTAATFKVTLSSAAPAGGLTISVTVTESDSYISGPAPATVFIASGATTSTLAVSTADDAADEPDGSITATINMGTSYRVGTPNTAMVTVTDDDVLLASITAGPSPITEGTAATFRVTLSIAAPTGGLTISVDVTESGSYILGPAPETVFIASGATTVTLTVLTEDDNLSEFRGGIIAVINAGIGYTAAADNEAEVTVDDNDDLLVEIFADSLTITEGADAIFQVSLSNAAPAGGLTVSVTVTESGSYIEGSAPTEVFIAAERSSFALTIPTVDDNLGEGGVITAVINAGAGYTVAAADNEAGVTVLDNDVIGDADGDGLIEIRTLTQLNNIRYNLGGTSAMIGCPTLASPIWVHDTTGEVLTSAPVDPADYTRRDTCYGYELVGNLDFNDANNDGNADDAYDTDLDTTNGNWRPIGDFNGFSGTFEGNGYTISNMSVAITRRNARLGEFGVGLFGIINRGAAIRDVGLVGVSVRGTGTNSDVGGLTGVNRGEIENSYVTGSVIGSVNGVTVGGLVGWNNGTIRDSYATGLVRGGNHAGGLVGDNNGTIRDSYATGSVRGGNRAGGLVGSNNGTIRDSYATTGSVRGGNHAGGLVGLNFGTIRDSYATGSVVGDGRTAGGLVGENFGTIRDSYATGSVRGGNRAGGLVGSNFDTIRNSYATGLVTGDGDIGGLVGLNFGTIRDSYATGSVVGDGGAAGGLVGINNGTIRNSYAIGSVTGRDGAGGLVGSYNSDATIQNSYWNIETSGQLSSAGGVGQTTRQLVTPTSTTDSIYESWTARSTALPGESLWDFGDNRQYPGLRLPLSTDDCTVSAGIPLCTHRPADPDPTARISAGPSPIIEGATVTFKVTLSSAAPAGGVTVSVGVTESGSYIEGSAPETVFIAEGATTGTLTVLTQDDNLGEFSSLIIAVINAGIGYTAAADNEAEVTVLDNDDPVVLIIAGPSPITEGTAATFRVILSSAAPAGGLTISVGVTESGSYIADPAPETVFIAAGATTVTLAVSTEDDDTGERSGSIIAVINAGAGYTVAPPPDNRARVRVLDNDEPIVEIYADNLTITEGEVATFILFLSSMAPAGGLTVSVRVTESGSYIDGLTPMEVFIAAGRFSFALTIPTADDNLGEGGVITAVINAGVGYTVAVVDNEAGVTVLDNDVIGDVDGNGLIEIRTLTQLNNIRYNLGGTSAMIGCPTLASPIWVHNTTGEVLTSAPSAQDTASYTRRDTCYGYELVRNLDFNDANNDGTADDAYDTDLDTTNGNWRPIGGVYSFTGTFDGNGFTISNMSIAITSTGAPVGLFGAIGSTGAVIRGVGLVGVSLRGGFDVGGLVGIVAGGTISDSYVTGSVIGSGDIGGLVGRNRNGGTISGSYFTGSVRGGRDTGGLVGENSSTISDSYATGSVNGGNLAGGLVGSNEGTIRDSYATGLVTGDGDVGGLVGSNEGTIRDSYATGLVTGDGDVGGLVGSNFDTIRDSYATGSVRGGNRAGGLVGWNFGNIHNSYAIGSVRGTDADGWAGGLVGENNSRSTISDSYATGSVVGDSRAAGGLVGLNRSDGTIRDSYATGSVNGGNLAGGLVGWNFGTIRNSYATGSVRVTGTNNVAGGLVGSNFGTIRNSYATGLVSGTGADGSLVGGLVGVYVSDATTQNSYWNTETSGRQGSAGGIGQTTLQLVTPTSTTGSIYESWTARSTALPGEPLWDFGDNRQYPGLRLPLSTDDCTVGAGIPLCTHRPADPGPTARITADPSPIIEGATVTFKVTLSSAAPAGGVTVSVGVTESGSYIEGSAPETVFIAEGATTGTLTVLTQDDNLGEFSSLIIAVINAGIGYTAAADNEAEVTVLDNDDPVVLIIAGPSPITEGTAATFRVILSSAAPAGGLTISVGVTESGSYIADPAPETVFIAAGATTVTLAVSTEDDDTGERSGSIIAVINAGAGYTVAPPPDNRARVRVLDNDEPIVEIYADNLTITEGEVATFILFLSSMAPAGGLTVSVRVTESGSYIDGLTPMEVFIAAGRFSFALTIPTADDNLGEGGVITAVINAGVGYTVAVADNEAGVTVLDNDVIGDADGDGLIEIRTLTQLNNIRYNLGGTSAMIGCPTLASPIWVHDTTGEVLTSAPVDPADYTRRDTCYGYELVGNLDFNDANNDGTADDAYDTDLDTTNGNWRPIGGVYSFTGTFDGNGFTISNMSVTITSTGAPVGLFGAIGSTGAVIRGVGLVGVSLRGGFDVGGLVGIVAGGTISDSYVTGSVIGSGDIGGLVGRNRNGGTISGSYFTGSVSGSVRTGGLVGLNDGTIRDSYATGSVRVTGADGWAGGLVGYNSGTIRNSYATGSVRVTGADGWAGGLVGSNEGTIRDSYATGLVTGDGDVGGLVGSNFDTIRDSYATGSVRGGNRAGGLVGWNFGNIHNSYAIGSVRGTDADGWAGGLVGENNSRSTISDSYATGSVVGDSRAAGGLVGLNRSDGNIRDSYATGSVNGGNLAGGLVGWNFGTIRNSYATGSVRVTGTNNVAGGLVGSNFGTIRNSYATGLVSDTGADGSLVGGLVGVYVSDATTQNSYWNTETSGQRVSAGGIGQTTLQLVTPTSTTGSIYESWTARSTALPDEPLWDFGDNRQYPGLRLPLSTDDCTVGAGTPLCTHRPADPDPTARITADPSPIIEGATVTFKVTLSSAAPAGGVTVSVGVTESGSYIEGSAPETVFIAEGATTGTLTVSTEDDNLDESNGVIITEINLGIGYAPAQGNSATFVTVLDDDVLLASISAVRSPITEGTDATFTVTLSSAAPAGGVTVRVGVTESGSYIADSAPTTVDIVAGETNGTLMVRTANDTTDEPDGSITAELNAGGGYTVGTLSTAMVTVNDNDDPVASISAGPSPITEGTAATFTVTLSSAAPADGLTIAVLTRTQWVGNDGLTILDGALETVFIASGATTGTLEVATDDLNEFGGTIFALIGRGIGYTVGTPNTATVTVYADGTVVSISAGPTPITEGAAATFTVTLSSAAPAGGLTISVDVTERESYIDGLAPETVFIAAGATTVTLTVLTDDDTTDESNGIIIAEINMGTGYTSAPGNLAAGVTVLDNDDPAPVASITATDPNDHYRGHCCDLQGGP